MYYKNGIFRYLELFLGFWILNWGGYFVDVGGDDDDEIVNWWFWYNNLGFCYC